MTGLRLYDAGYTDLVSVVPPKAELAPTTSLSKGARGKVPGRPRLDGRWVGYPFVQEDPPSRQDVERWETSWDANIGLLAEHYPGLDVDCDDPQLAQLVVQEALKELGPAPLRTSRDPRRLLVYRTDEPFSRMAATVTFRGQEHVVEVLGTGRQYLVHGGHPSGHKYGWDGEPLWEWKPDSLTPISAARVSAFFDHLADKLQGRAEVRVKGSGETPAEQAPPQETLRAPGLDALADVVALIPNEYPDRGDYIQVGCAIKAAAGPQHEGDAFELFADWADRWTEGDNEPETVEADWRRMHPPFRVGWRFLQDLAAEATDYLPAVDEFQADPDAEPPPKADEQDFNPAGLIDYTDTWVVERLARALAPIVRYVPETGHFHTWNGHAWAQDRRNAAEYLIRQQLIQLSREVRERAAVHPDEKAAKKMYKTAGALQSRSALTKALPELQAHPALTLTVADFDADPWLLNTPGGLVDLRTGELEDSDPAALTAKSTAVAPKPGTPTRWMQFMEEATGGDAELQHYLQKLVGYSLTGVTQEQTLAFIHGPPLTGKSVFIEAIGGLFGTYHENAPAETFASSRSDRHPTDLAKLAGARLVTAVETQEGRAWDTQRVKSITGGDTISARFMRQDFFDFRPTFQILIVGNHEPEIKGVDEALMRRLHVVPFENRPDTVDRLLGSKLKEEWPRILSWAIEGCLLWLKEGLQPPTAVLARTERYRREEDPVGQFLEECCEFGDPTAETTRRDLYRVWSEWCGRQGEHPGTLKQVKRRFRAKEKEYGFTDARLWDGNSRVRGYQGMKLIEQEGVLV